MSTRGRGRSMSRTGGLVGGLLAVLLVVLLVDGALSWRRVEPRISHPHPQDWDYVEWDGEEWDEEPSAREQAPPEKFSDHGPPVLDGEPASYEVDEAVTLHDVAFAAVTLEEGIWLVSMRVRNDDGVTREIKLPDNDVPRYERTGDGLRVSWLRGLVESSDPETGDVTFFAGSTGTDLVAVFRRQELVVEDQVIPQGAVDPDTGFELCLEVLPPSDPDSTAAWLRTGERTIADAGYEDGETVLLACGSATRGEDVAYLEDEY